MATYAAFLRKEGIDGTTIRKNANGTLSSNVPMQPVGKSFYVDSVNGLAANDGLSWETSLTTIDAAIGKCTANAGDIIYVAPTHQETEAAAASLLTMDIAGVTLIGVSNGGYAHTVATGAATVLNMPTLILDHASATITISAANCRVSGFNIVTDVADVAVAVTVAATADGSIIDNCVIQDNAANLEYLVGISVAAAANNVQLIDNVFETTAAGGTNNAILLVGADTGLVIKGNRCFGKFATGCILGSAGKHTGITLSNNTLVNAEAAVACALKTDSTGIASGNYMAGTTSIAAAWTGSDALWCFQNFITGAVNASAIIDPAVDAD